MPKQGSKSRNSKRSWDDQELEEWYKEMLRLEKQAKDSEPTGSTLFQSNTASDEQVQNYIDICKSILVEKTEYSRKDIKVLIQEAEAINIRDKAIAIVFELLFDDPAKFTNIVTKHMRLLYFFVNERPVSQRNLIRTLDLYMREEPSLLPQTPRLLQFLYNEDLVEEEVFLEYFADSKRNRNEFRRRATRFIDWLKFAQEEDCSEDTSDEEEAQKVEKAPQKSADDDEEHNGIEAIVVGDKEEILANDEANKNRCSSSSGTSRMFANSAGGDIHHSMRRGRQMKVVEEDDDSIDKI